MTPFIRRWLPILAAGFLFSPIFVQQTFADDSTSPAKDDVAEREKSIREQDIYIPYDKLRQVFEKHGRGVFLPYDKFQELWKAAQDKTQSTTEVKPPVGSVITEIENDATVEKDVVRVKAKVKIELLAEGWQEIPLRLSDAAIISAKLGDQPARLLGTAGQDYRLLIEKKGKMPEQIELILEYAKAITRSPGQNSVSFQTPQAPVSRWKVTIPQAGVKVNLQPLIAATEVPPVDKAADGEKKDTEGEKKADETIVLAFVGAAPTVQIDWTPKSEGATGLAALAGVQTQQQLSIKESVVHCTTVLEYTISRAELSKLSIEVPADYKVVNVFDENVRQWTIEAAEAKQKINVELFEPAKRTQRVVVELEKIAGEKAQDTIHAPIVKALEASRQQGIVVVQIAEGLRGEVAKTAGLLQIDASELPPALAKEKWDFSYRYATASYELAISVEKILPRILVDTLVEAYLEPNNLTLDSTAIYNIERAGVFKLELDLPPGFNVQSVRGVEVAGAVGVRVDNHRLEGENKTHLVVNLSSKAIGKVALYVVLQKELQLPELLAPSAKSAEIELQVPRIMPEGVERATGRLVVYAPESLRVNPGKVIGLRTISYQEAFESMQSPRADKPGGVRPVLAYAFNMEPTSFQLLAERRKPQVTVRQLLSVRIEDDVAKYQATFFYNVLYSGVKSLRIDIPEEIAKKSHTKTTHETIVPPPEGLPQGYVAWRLTNDAELFGDGKIELVWEKKIDKLDIGKSVDLVLPHLKPAEVDRAWGQIVLSKSETIDLREKEGAEGLQPIDPQQDLMEKVEGAARAFVFHDDWEMTVTATRYQLEEVKRTSIERGIVRMVITPANEISVQALYRIRTARDRLKIAFPSNANVSNDPPKINGQSVMLEKQNGDYYIPIVAPNADTPFVLEIRYTLPDSDGRLLDMPIFPQDPAVQKEYLAFYLPEKKTLMDVEGPWTKEYGWERNAAFMWQPVSNMDMGSLLNWVRDGVQSPGMADNFQTDGTLYLYSTLRPEAPPKGSLELTIVDARWLQALMFLGVFLGGLILVPARCRFKMLGMGMLVAAIVLVGVFYPILAMQILNGILALSIFLAIVLWFVAWGFHMQRRPIEKSPVGGEAVPVTSRDSGVDLSQYEPHSSEPPKASAPEGSEGGKDHE